MMELTRKGEYAIRGIIYLARLPQGKVVLGRPASQITLREVVEAVEGQIMPNRCLMGEYGCESSRTCLVHPVWRTVQEKVVEILDGVTIEELAKSAKR
ncbi:MAG: Rrf2 family transcriptional regulator [Geobacter sp.]|nr:Rrf2 family transcriptional regulator [Geobacter sp.]